MIIIFEKEYLQELYEKGKASDKKHRFQPEIVRKYIRVIDIMISQLDITSLSRYNSLNYEKLQGDKKGTSSIRVNNQYRIEFTERTEDNQTIATICCIIELSNHYK